MDLAAFIYRKYIALSGPSIRKVNALLLYADQIPCSCISQWTPMLSNGVVTKTNEDSEQESAANFWVVIVSGVGEEVYKEALRIYNSAVSYP